MPTKAKPGHRGAGLGANFWRDHRTQPHTQSNWHAQRIVCRYYLQSTIAQEVASLCFGKDLLETPFRSRKVRHAIVGDFAHHRRGLPNLLAMHILSQKWHQKRAGEGWASVPVSRLKWPGKRNREALGGALLKLLRE